MQLGYWDFGGFGFGGGRDVAARCWRLRSFETARTDVGRAEGKFKRHFFFSLEERSREIEKRWIGFEDLPPTFPKREVRRKFSDLHVMAETKLHPGILSYPSQSEKYITYFLPDSIEMAATPHTPKLRSLYRRLLRELPPPSATAQPPSRAKPSILSHPSPLQRRIRSNFASAGEPSKRSSKSINQRLQETEQFIQYLKAQRQYVSLLERYNPGMNMNEEERVRLTARRVGMDLPKEFLVKPFGDGKG